MIKNSNNWGHITVKKLLFQSVLKSKILSDKPVFSLCDERGTNDTVQKI